MQIDDLLYFSDDEVSYEESSLRSNSSEHYYNH